MYEFISYCHILTRNPDFITHALCLSLTTISRQFPIIRETGWTNQTFWNLSKCWSRNYVLR